MSEDIKDLVTLARDNGMTPAEFREEVVKCYMALVMIDLEKHDGGDHRVEVGMINGDKLVIGSRVVKGNNGVVH